LVVVWFICLCSWKNHILYSKMCYFGTTKVEMIKFATIMANCVQNNLWKFRKRTLKYTENNDICLRGVFFLPHTVNIGLIAIKVQSCQKSRRNLDVFSRSQFFWGVQAFQKLYPHYHPCLCAARRLEKFRADNPASPKVFETHTLKTNIDKSQV